MKASSWYGVVILQHILCCCFEHEVRAEFFFPELYYRHRHVHSSRSSFSLLLETWLSPQTRVESDWLTQRTEQRELHGHRKWRSCYCLLFDVVATTRRSSSSSACSSSSYILSGQQNECFIKLASNKISRTRIVPIFVEHRDISK